MENVAFIVNPNSAKKNYAQFVNALRAKVPGAEIYISTSVVGTEEFIQKNFERIGIFIAVGGDGTISSVAKKLLNSSKILGIFPAGSGNGFARENAFSKNLEILLDKIRRGEFREIDTLQINGRFSLNVSGTGFDGEVVKEFEKTSRGFRNYIKVSLATYFKFKPVQVTFHAPEYQKFDGQYLMVNVANTRQFGNNAYIAPHASTVDGLAEVVLVKKFPAAYAATFAARMFLKKLKADRFVTYLSVPEIRFSVSSDDWHLDGDHHRITSPVLVKVLPRSLKILN